MSRSTRMWIAIAALLIAAAAAAIIGSRRGGDHGALPSAGGNAVHATEHAPALGRGAPARFIGNAKPASDGSWGLTRGAANALEASALDKLSAPSVATLEFAQSLAPDEAPKRRNPKEPEIFDLLRKSKGTPISQRVRDLSEEITRDATNEMSRAQAIYNWLTHNIVYDTAEWENIASGSSSGYIHDHDPESVLDRGSTVCIGYAWLFDHLCEAAGIEATWLIGDVRGYRGTSDEQLVDGIRHAWNAVKLDDGEWHLLDATWGALQEGEEETQLSKKRMEYYFDVPPSQFVYDHLPEDDNWQLLGDGTIPSDVAFSILPNLKPSFFTNGLGLGDGFTSELGASAGSAAMLPFSVPEGVNVSATLGVAGDASGFAPLDVAKIAGSGDRAALLPKLTKGDYILRIYSGPERARLLECSADFLIKVR